MGRQKIKRGDFPMQRTRHRLVIMQSARDAALWPSPHRGGIETRVKAWLAAVALTGIAWCQPAAAASAACLQPPLRGMCGAIVDSGRSWWHMPDQLLARVITRADWSDYGCR